MYREEAFFSTPEEVSLAINRRRVALRLTRHQLSLRAGVTEDQVFMAEDAGSCHLLQLVFTLRILEALGFKVRSLPAPVSFPPPVSFDLDEHLRRYHQGE